MCDFQSGTKYLIDWCKWCVSGLKERFFSQNLSLILCNFESDGTTWRGAFDNIKSDLIDARYDYYLF